MNSTIDTNQKKESGLAVAGMVIGIVSLVFVCIPLISILSPFLAITGIILSSIALSKINKGEAGGKGMAVAGLVTSIVTLVIYCAAIFVTVPLLFV